MPPMFPTKIQYGEKSKDDKYEYRHVSLTADAYSKLPDNYRDFYQRFRNKDPYEQNDNHEDYSKDMILISTEEVEAAGVRISKGWRQYLVFPTEPHVLLLR